MANQVLGSFRFTPSNPKPGDSVLVEALGPDGQPVNAAHAADVFINGAPGARRFVQVPGSSPLAFQAVLRQAGAAAEHVSASLPVAAPARIAARPKLLQIAHLPMAPHKVGIAFSDAPALPRHIGDGKLLSSTLYALPRLAMPRPGETPLHTWTFGDGSRLGTMSPVAQHDYSGALEHLTEFQHFDVAIAGPGGEARQTLTFCNHYARIKRVAGRLHPPVVATTEARRVGGDYLGQVTIFNPENGAISLQSRRISFERLAAGEIATPGAPTHLVRPIVVGPRATHVMEVSIPLTETPADAVGFSAHFGGVGPAGEPVRVSAHFDLNAEERLRKRGPSVPFNSQFDRIVASLAGGRRSVTLTELRATGAAGLPAFEAARRANALRIHAGLAPASAGTSQALTMFRDLAPDSLGPLTPPPPDPPPAVGNQCYPDNLPSNIPQGFACVATTETQDVAYLSRFMNALKGDVILAPGGAELVGQLLTQVDVPQLYSHCGMMTRNYDQITHCTASQDRIQAYPVGSIIGDGPEPTHGFRNDVLKYGWPGTVTQLVEHAIYGEPIVDPDPSAGGAQYTLQDFNAGPSTAEIRGSWVIIPPLVVKPDPMLETEALRRQLHAVADNAVAQTGKFHYRFFLYSNSALALDSVAPAEAGWAKGTTPGTCSAFIWTMMKKSNVRLMTNAQTLQQGDLSPQQIGQGAKVGPRTLDGLSHYSAAERGRAATWLHDALVQQIDDKLSSKASIFGGLIDLLTKLEAHVSNQFVNAFASDHIQNDDDHEDWRSPGEGDAVSPDNIMLWNGPSAAAAGPYGYHEPAIYREPRYETVTVSRWKQVTQFGSLTGRVTFNGQPIPGARVQVFDGKFAASDNNGAYTIANVPFGDYILTADKLQPDGMVLHAAPRVSVNAPVVHFDVPVSPPPDDFRTLFVDGTMHTRWSKHVIIKVDEKSKDSPIHGQVRLGPRQITGAIGFDNNVEDANGHLQLNFTWRPDKSVKVDFTLSLHNKNTANSFVLPPNASQGWQAHVDTDNDNTDTNFTVRNVVTQA